LHLGPVLHVMKREVHYL